MQYSYFQFLFFIEINTTFAILTLGSQNQNWIKGMQNTILALGSQIKLDWKYSKCNIRMAFTNHTLGFSFSNVIPT